MASYLPPSITSVFNKTAYTYGQNALTVQEAFKYFLPINAISGWFSNSSVLSIALNQVNITLTGTFQNLSLDITSTVNYLNFVGTPNFNQMKIAVTNSSLSDYNINNTALPGGLPIKFSGGANKLTIPAGSTYILSVYTDNSYWFINAVSY